MGLSRDTLYRYKSAVDEGGVEALFDKTRRKPNITNRIEKTTESAVVHYAIDSPAHGQASASNELRKQSVFISSSGVRFVRLRNQLASFKDHLRTLENKVAREGIIPTEV